MEFHAPDSMYCLTEKKILVYFWHKVTAVFSDLGAHIDGFCAVVAHTIVVGASKDRKVTGRKADAIMAAHLASEAALRLVKPGTEVRQL